LSTDQTVDLRARGALAFTVLTRFVVLRVLATFFVARRAVPERFVLAAAFTVRVPRRAAGFFEVFVVFAVAAIGFLLVFPEASLTVCPDESARLAETTLPSARLISS
jgi:hypothetical protein